jgi:hypothetical protein
MITFSKSSCSLPLIESVTELVVEATAVMTQPDDDDDDDDDDDEKEKDDDEGDGDADAMNNASEAIMSSSLRLLPLVC